jgi:hypothetical protein
VANISHKFSLEKVINRPGKECTVIGRKGLLWQRHMVWKNRSKADKLTMIANASPFYKLFTLFIQLFPHQQILTYLARGGL